MADQCKHTVEDSGNLEHLRLIVHSCVLLCWDVDVCCAVLCCVGVRAARAAGIPVFGITSGQDPAVLLEAGCCMLIQDFTQLVALAQQHCQAAAAGTDAAANGNGNGWEQQQQQQPLTAAGKLNASGSQHAIHIIADSRQSDS